MLHDPGEVLFVAEVRQDSPLEAARDTLVAAKAAFLLSDDGPGWLDERGLAGRFLAGDVVVVTNRAWRDSVPEAA